MVELWELCDTWWSPVSRTFTIAVGVGRRLPKQGNYDRCRCVEMCRLGDGLRGRMRHGSFGGHDSLLNHKERRASAISILPIKKDKIWRGNQWDIAPAKWCLTTHHLAFSLEYLYTCLNILYSYLCLLFMALNHPARLRGWWGCGRCVLQRVLWASLQDL